MAKKIDWPYWRKLREVKIYEAVSLLLGEEPEDGPPDLDDVSTEYRKTMRLLLDALSDQSFFTPGTRNIGNSALHGVRLAEVGAWAVANGYTLPTEFPIASPSAEGSQQGTQKKPPPDLASEDEKDVVAWYNALLNAEYWFGINSVQPQEAAMLLCEFNPHDTNANPETTTNSDTNPEDYKRLLRKFEDLAVTVPLTRPLVEWLAVAKNSGLKYHPWVDGYISARPSLDTDLDTARRSQSKPKRNGENEWVSDAQERAREIIKEMKERDLYPSQENIADQIAREFRAAGRVGMDGKPLSGAYIKRHALKGISSAVHKQLGTGNRQGK